MRHNWDNSPAILRDAGLNVTVGRYSIRVNDCSDFVFVEYGGDLGEPCIDAGADSTEEMIRDAKLVSDALAQATIPHRFEIIDDQNAVTGYLHHDWPQDD